MMNSSASSSGQDCCPKFDSNQISVASGATPSQTLGASDYGLTYPENVVIDISACKKGGAWHPCLKKLTGNYSVQARLLPGQQEVTGIGGNTTQANFCAQVTELKALGFGASSAKWYMLAAVRAHEAVHETHCLPALKAVAAQIEADVKSLSIADTGQTEAQAINQFLALSRFTTIKTHAQQLWLAKLVALANGDHSGPTDVAEHAVVDPMIAAICAHASASSWGPCAAC